ncbi:MAG TPA: hypothetical protein VLE24_05535, partial [Methyloceanibacter sp.]|nr:hypothetical protein [Methyloceanibacter sp.]
MKVLASMITPEKAQVAVNAVVDVIRDSKKKPNARQVRALQALPVQLAPEQAEVVAGRILDTIAKRNLRFRSFDELLPLTESLEALPV